jgi:hypothetical protein
MSCYLAKVIVNDEIKDGKQSTSSTSHFDQHGGAPVRHKVHSLMWHAQGYSGSHWTLLSGNYSLCIALAAARATINKTSIQNTPPLLAISMAVVMCRYYTAHIT